MGIFANLMATIFAGYDEQIDDAETHVRRLIDQRAGLAPDTTGQDGRCRLRQPRLITTAPLQRCRALEKKMLDYRDVIATALPQAIAAAIKLEIAKDEIAVIHDRESVARADWQQFHDNGIFTQAALKVTRLYERHKISRWHWANADDDQLAAIAAILQRTGGTGNVA